MPDLRWDEIRSLFDPDLMGALPDVSVDDASTEDWQAVFDLVRSRGWAWEYRVGDVVTPLPSAAEALARPADAELAELRVWPSAGVMAIFRLYSADQIDFDVDVRELREQRGVDVLCDLLRTIGRRLGKPGAADGGRRIRTPAARVRPECGPCRSPGRPAFAWRSLKKP
ncbi:hypothetical protein ACFXPA_20010 [Amycolatopsis sp. NPDC059090]|uniref:hypothetical protein n=1 Tax=unclassified Amycolatopsis TaxID=2618356 RepID=UPI00366A9DFF